MDRAAALSLILLVQILWSWQSGGLGERDLCSPPFPSESLTLLPTEVGYFSFSESLEPVPVIVTYQSRAIQSYRTPLYVANELLTLGPGTRAILILFKNSGPGQTGIQYS